jgi:hypothetical protein
MVWLMEQVVERMTNSPPPPDAQKRLLEVTRSAYAGLLAVLPEGRGHRDEVAGIGSTVPSLGIMLYARHHQMGRARSSVAPASPLRLRPRLGRSSPALRRTLDLWLLHPRIAAAGSSCRRLNTSKNRAVEVM